MDNLILKILKKMGMKSKKDKKASEPDAEYPVIRGDTIYYSYPSKEVYPQLHRNKSSQTDEQSKKNTEDKTK